MIFFGVKYIKLNKLKNEINLMIYKVLFTKKKIF